MKGLGIFPPNLGLDQICYVVTPSNNESIWNQERRRRCHAAVFSPLSWAAPPRGVPSPPPPPIPAWSRSGFLPAAADPQGSDSGSLWSAQSRGRSGRTLGRESFIQFNASDGKRTRSSRQTRRTLPRQNWASRLKMQQHKGKVLKNSSP